MTFRTLILRSLRFHWRAHLGVLLGAAVGSAALIGALVVGDSVRGSLRDMALQRLGWVHVALFSPDRFFTENLAPHDKAAGFVFRSSSSSDLRNPQDPMTAGLMLFGTVARQDGSARANQVTVLGVNSDFWRASLFFPEKTLTDFIPSNTVVINEALAAQLHARPGDALLLRVPKVGGFSREVPIATQNDASSALRLKVHAIAKPSELGNFSLYASQLPPLNAFVRIDQLESLPGLAGKRNLLLAGQTRLNDILAPPGQWQRILDRLPDWLHDRLPSKWKPYPEGEKSVSLSPEDSAAHDSIWIKELARLPDYELQLSKLTNVDVLELRSSRIFLEPPVVKAAFSISNSIQKGLQKLPASGCQPILTYLVNQFRADTNATPYSMITAAGTPWTPPGMADDEILINTWLAEDLNLKPDDTLDFTYFLPESAANLVEATNRFRVRAIVPIEGIYADRTLMPEFPGLAKAESTHDWDAGFPLVHKIRDTDEDYWKKHRGTPKAYVTLAAGQKMWGNRFGNLTAIRWPVPPGTTADQFQILLERHLRANLDPAEMGLRFEPVRSQMLASASQSQDFGQLFLGFSFFLILAALILVALLFQFGLEQRITEVGTFLALGFTPKQVRRLFLGEAAALSFLGAIIGVVGGIAYARAMLEGLTTIWRGAVQTSALTFHTRFSTLVIGLCSSTIISTITIALVLRKQARRPARELLADGDEAQPETPATKSPKSTTLWLATIGLLAALILVLWGLYKGEAAAGLFFGSGALFLLAGLAYSAQFLSELGRRASAGLLTILSLGIRGCTRRRKRSLATIALLACGCFIIVAVGANRLDATRDAQKRSSGTGGFALIGQSALPVVHDLNTERGRDFYSLDATALQGVTIVPLRVRDGDDASCLNLNRAQKPRLLGVDPVALKTRGAFTFVKVARGHSLAEAWDLLNTISSIPNYSAQPSINEIPAIGDMNSIMWAMGKKIGDTIDYTDDFGQPLRLRLVGAVANSILQGNLLISDANFRRYFPTETGARVFLIDAPADRASSVSAILSPALQNVGLELTPALDRLAAFNAVQNTYLNTFQILGGLGLLLGSVGLGLVVLRNVLERRGELALLQAVGFRHRTLHWLVLSEHAGLLWLGLAIGILSALVAILPVLLAPGAAIHYRSLFTTLLAVFASGMLWAFLATTFALRSPLLPALRNE